ncbi:hypothetical protein, partial [Methanocalculus natronophilus]|uniref:hypothetical protein n=1 Tax=Methanocalculus natronophilus TaxID=1262400 RepID=UPI0031B5BE26
DISVTIDNNTFETKEEGIGLGDGVEKTQTIVDLLTDNTFDLEQGYAVVDYRDGQEFEYGQTVKVNSSNDFHRILEHPEFTKVIIGSSFDNSVYIDRPVDIDFKGRAIAGNIEIQFTEEATMHFTGNGMITDDLIINAPFLTLESDVNVLGETYEYMFEQNFDFVDSTSNS